MSEQSLLKSKSMFDEIRTLIEQTRQQVAVTVNSAMTMLYWRIGRRINSEILQERRAEYGKQIISTLSCQLRAEYGSGWSEKHLRHCLRIAETFPDEAIVSALGRELSWSHIKTLMYINDELKRTFYIEMCRMEKWSTRTLQGRINSMLYERTAISKKPQETIKRELRQLAASGQISPDLVFRDPYFLDFLGLKDSYSEKDLETAILREMETFILELGIGFTFIARQKRITVDGDDYYIDLLFYHRRLRRLVVIELKLGEFKPAYKGQMELYLRWLDKYERQANEEAPLGMILCAGMKREQIELLELSDSGIHVAEYLIELPPLELLRDKLHKAIETARNRISGRKGEELE